MQIIYVGYLCDSSYYLWFYVLGEETQSLNCSVSQL